MRHTQGPRYKFEETPRKRAAVLVRQRKDRDKLPLFGELIRETQLSVDETMERRRDNWANSVARNRAERASQWLSARARLNQLPEPGRTAFLTYWNTSRYPGDPSYLHTVLRMFEDGRLVLHEGRIRMQSDLDWQNQRDAEIRAMTDAELDHMIQTHISLQFVDLGRAERQRRIDEANAA